MSGYYIHDGGRHYFSEDDRLDAQAERYYSDKAADEESFDERYGDEIDHEPEPEPIDPDLEETFALMHSEPYPEPEPVYLDGYGAEPVKPEPVTLMGFLSRVIGDCIDGR